MKGVYRNISLMSVGSAVTSILTLVAVALTIKLIGLERYGALIIGQAIASIFSSALVPQAWEIIQKFGAMRSVGSGGFASVFSRWRRVEYVFTLVAMLLSVIVVRWLGLRVGVDGHLDVAAAGAISILLSNITSHVGFLRSLDKFAPTVSAPIVTRCARIAALGVAWAVTLGPLATVVLAYVVAELLRIVYLEHVAAGETRGQSSGGRVTYEEVRFAAVLCLTRCADVPVQQLDKILAGAFLGPVDAGYLAIIRRIASIAGLFADPIRHSMSPKIYQLVAEGEYRIAVSFAGSLAGKILAIGAVFIVAMVGLEGTLLPLITSTTWPPSATLTLEITVGAMIVALAFVSIHTFCYAFGKQRYVLGITVLSNLVFVVLLLSLVRAFGLLAFGVAFAVQYLLSIGAKLYLLREYVPTRRYRTG